MKKYFIYRLKKCVLPFALLALACALIYVLPVAAKNYDYWNTHPECKYVTLYTDNALAMLALMSIAAPVFFFSYKMNKRSVDMHFSLPISRTKIAAVNFICGYLCVFAAFSTGYLLGFLMIVSKVRRLYLLNYLWIYLASIIPSLVFYTLSAFCFTRANTVIDGIVFIITGLFTVPIVYLIAYCIGVAANGAGAMPTVNGFLPWTAFDKIITCLGSRIYGGTGDVWEFYKPAYYEAGYIGYDYLYERYTSDVTELVGVITMTALGIAAAFGLFFTEKNCKAEKCGQVSDSIFGYKGCIPLYLLALCMVCGNDVLMLGLLACGAVALTIVYRRTVKLGKKHAVLLAIYLAVSILCGILVNLRYFL